MKPYAIAIIACMMLCGLHCSKSGDRNPKAPQSQASGRQATAVSQPASASQTEPASQSRPAVESKTIETLLIPADMAADDLVVSADGLHAAFVLPTQEKYCVVTDGQKGALFTKIGRVEISDDGKHVAYVARNGEKLMLVIDGRAGEEFDSIDTFAFEPRSGLAVCIAQNKPEAGKENFRAYVVTNNKTMGPYDNASFSSFSPSGTSWAAIFVQKSLMHCVVDGREGDGFGTLSRVTFSPDGKRFGYIGSDPRGLNTVVIDRKTQAQYQVPANEQDEKSRHHQPVIDFSPDSRRVAYPVFTPPDQWSMRVDGVDGHGGLSLSQFIFSPDSKHFAYVAARKGGQTLIADGQEKGTYERIDSLQFSPDSGHICFIAIKDGKHLVVLDDKEGPTMSSPFAITPPVFSPDSKHVVYSARDATKAQTWLYFDEGQVGPFQVVTTPVFRPDGRRWACSAQREGKWLEIVDGKQLPEYDAVGEVAFSLDGRRFAYVARQGKENLIVREDGSEGPRLGAIWTPMFLPDRRVAYQAMTGGEAWVVVDGQKGPTFEGTKNVQVTPGGHLVYQGRRDGKWSIVIDQREYGPYESDLPYAVGADGSINHVARKAGAWYRVQHTPVK